MNDADIIKALECCSEAEFKEDCKKMKCPFFDNEIYNCMNVDDENAMHRYSLDLIKHQQAEIERLRDMVGQNEGVLPEYEKLLKSEAIREFAEKLKEKCLTPYPYVYEIANSDIDNLVKQMTGDKK